VVEKSTGDEEQLLRFKEVARDLGLGGVKAANRLTGSWAS
jgi:hypothetical protein